MTEEKKPFYIFKLCLIGAGAVGKTCIAKRLCFNSFDIDTKLTIGIDFYTYDIPAIVNGNKENIRLSIWDFGGQEQFKKLFHYYINGANGILMVFSLIDIQTLVGLDWWYDKLVEYKQQNTPKALVGTKNDLIKKIDKKDGLIIKNFQKRYSEKHFFKTSSKDNVNIKETFIEMTKNILEKNNLDYDKLG